MGKKKRVVDPAEAERLRGRLERARSEQLLVRIRRWIPGADVLEGFVVGLGHEWVALARLSDTIELDGWILLRLRDVRSVKITPDREAFEIRALEAREQWPPVVPPVRLDDVTDVISDVTAIAPMLAVHCELDRPDVCWIGAVRRLQGTTLWLLQVTTQAGWARAASSFDLDDITRLDVGGGYEEALHLVAGAPPRGSEE